MLASTYPLDRRYEEVSLPGTGGLAADFFVPSRKLVVEVQGVQHEKFVAHFHKNRLGFFAGQHRDQRKAEWCEVNGFDLVELTYNESDEEWRRHIVDRGKAGEP